MSSAVQSAATGTELECLDDEHQEIIRLVHDFDGLLSAGGTTEQVIDLFAVVLANIKHHFDDEERLMRKWGYDDYAAHKAAHDRLLEELKEVMTDCEKGAYAERHGALARRISEWFSAHLERMDAALIEAGHGHKGHAGS